MRRHLDDGRRLPIVDFKAARCAVQNEVDNLPPLGVECLHL